MAGVVCLECPDVAGRRLLFDNRRRGVFAAPRPDAVRLGAERYKRSIPIPSPKSSICGQSTSTARAVAEHMSTQIYRTRIYWSCARKGVAGTSSCRSYPDPCVSAETRMHAYTSLPRPGDRRALTITRLLLPAPTRIRRVLPAKNLVATFDAEWVIVYEGLFDDEDAAPDRGVAMWALATVPLRRVRRGSTTSWRRSTASPIAGAAAPTADSGTTRSATWRGHESPLQNVVSRVVAVAGGDDHSCVLLFGGNAGGVEGSEVVDLHLSWGGNARGQLGTGDRYECLTPTRASTSAPSSCPRRWAGSLRC